jgi:hypothetical protein
VFRVSRHGHGRRMAKDGQARRHVEDDVLTGFDRTGERKAEFRGFFATSMAASVYVWNAMFELGAYRTIFFYREDEYLVLATVVFVGVLVVRQQVRERPWLFAAVAPPALYLLFRLASPDKHPGGVLGLVSNVLIVLNGLALPLMVWVIARLLAPDYFEVRGVRLKLAVVAILVGIAVAGFLAGHFNYRYLSCEDFEIAGLEPPGNCHPDPPG